MESLQFEIFLGQRTFYGIFRRTVGERKAEFAVRLCRLDKMVRVGFHPRIHAKKYLLLSAVSGADLVEQFEFGKRIDDDRPHSVPDCIAKLCRQLVIAVEVYLLCGKARPDRGIYFPFGNAVHTYVFRRSDPVYRHTGKRFGGIKHDPVPAVFAPDRIAVYGTHRADICFVHHIERRTEGSRQRNGIGTADLEVTFCIDFQGISRIHGFPLVLFVRVYCNKMRGKRQEFISVSANSVQPKRRALRAARRFHFNLPYNRPDFSSGNSMRPCTYRRGSFSS